ESLYAQIYAYNPKLGADGAAKLLAQAEILKKGVTLGKGAPEVLEWGGTKGPPGPPTTPTKPDQALALRAGGPRAAYPGERRERELDGPAPRALHRRGLGQPVAFVE